MRRAELRHRGVWVPGTWLWQGRGDALEEVTLGLAQGLQGLARGEQAEKDQGRKELSSDEFHLAFSKVWSAPVVIAGLSGKGKSRAPRRGLRGAFELLYLLSWGRLPATEARVVGAAIQDAVDAGACIVLNLWIVAKAPRRDGAASSR